MTHGGRLRTAYERMGAEQGRHDPWTEERAARVEAEWRATVAPGQWEDRAAWRDRAFMAPLAARQSNA